LASPPHTTLGDMPQCRGKCTVCLGRGTVGAGVAIPLTPLRRPAKAPRGRLDGTPWGAVILRPADAHEQSLQLVATGGYQLAEAMKASTRLQSVGIDHSVVYLQEPGRFRTARDEREAQHVTPPERVDALFPPSATARVFLTHTHAEPYIGTIWPLLSQPIQTRVLGFINHGGTLDEPGMLFANRCTWAHALSAAALALGESADRLLEEREYAALIGQGHPSAVTGAELNPVG
jgi:phosphoketolase